LIKFGNGIDKILEEILDKKFIESLSYGYDSNDVDAFFDKVCEYIKVVLHHCQKKVEENELLESQLNKALEEKNAIEKEKEDLIIENRNLKDQGYGSINAKNQEKYLNKKLEERMNSQQELINQLSVTNKNLTEAIEKLTKNINDKK
jgi:agmatine/peptidylarginine deiminase